MHVYTHTYIYIYIQQAQWKCKSPKWQYSKSRSEMNVDHGKTRKWLRTCICVKAAAADLQDSCWSAYDSENQHGYGLSRFSAGQSWRRMYWGSRGWEVIWAFLVLNIFLESYCADGVRVYAPHVRARGWGESPSRGPDGHSRVTRTRRSTRIHGQHLCNVLRVGSADENMADCFSFAWISNRHLLARASRGFPAIIHISG